MAHSLLALAFAAAATLCHAQDASLATILNFETDQTGKTPSGWRGGPEETIFLDSEIVHSGHWAVRLERTASSAGTFTTITKSLPMEFGGKTIEMRGFLRTENITDFVGLWMREDGDAPSLAFDNMQNRHLKGTTDWQEYSITLPVRSEAKRLFFGVLAAGTGKAWADDLQLLVDGKPIWEAPHIERPKTVVDLDREFDRGSRVALVGLSDVQIGNLATLAKVWGFLKYHHPEITTGKRHWDYDLFRIMPGVLAAPDRNAGNAALVKWIDGVGAVSHCDSCARLKEDDLQLRSDVAWISDESRLGKELSARLLSIRENRLAGTQFYVSFIPNVGNPKFEHELSYGSMPLPDAGFRLLGLFRYWNIIQYWSPNREVMGADWDAVLTQSIPKLALAKDSHEYHRELIRLIAQVNDTHANLWGALADRPPDAGACNLPFRVRFVENQAVVTGYLATEGRATGLQIGDVISELNGVPVAQLVKDWTPYYADSNDAARLRDIARNLIRGACDKPVTLRVGRGKDVLDLTAKAGDYPDRETTHDLPGATCRLLSDDIAYIKISGIKGTDLAKCVDAAAKTKGLIIDIRNYPSAMTISTLGAYLVTKTTPFARFTNGDLSNPGAFHWTESQSIQPGQPHYKGKVVILVDEITQSSAEYHAMAFRAAPGAVVIGSMTAGADGNVSQIPLPGALNTMISGIGVFYPDKRPTQRIGIVPDKEVKPTIAGIRAGRDEVLEGAMHEIPGPDAKIPDSRELLKGSDAPHKLHGN
jgi:C-terminal processing protease CtpA/Prc